MSSRDSPPDLPSKSDASTLVDYPTPPPSLVSDNSSSNNNEEDHIGMRRISARDRLGFDHHGLRFCDGKRSRASTINNNAAGDGIITTRTFEVLDVRYGPGFPYLKHRNSLDLDRNGSVLCEVRGSAPWRKKREFHHHQEKKGGFFFKRRWWWWRSLKQQVCEACEEEARILRNMVNYLKPTKKRRSASATTW